MARIGIDARMYRPGATGIGRYIYELTNHIFSIDSENEYVIFLNKEAYDSYIPINNRIKKVLTDAKYYSVEEQTVFIKDLNKEKLDLIHFTHFNAPVLYFKPSIVTIHDLTLSKFPGQKMNTIIHRLGYNMTIRAVTKNAKKIIAVSEHTKKDLIEILNIDKNKISVVYEGIEENFKKVTDKKAITDLHERFKIDNKFFLYVGVWRNHKNLVNLVEAFKKFKDKYKFDHKLVITGREDSKNYPEVRNKINELKLQDEVITPGFVSEEDLITLYSTTEALINPSFYEGFGFPPLEAMACETPAIVSDASCHKEICENNALYFDPNNTDDISEKLNQIITDTKLKEKLITEGLKFVKKYKWSYAGEKTLELYKEILKQKKPIDHKGIDILEEIKKGDLNMEKAVTAVKDTFNIDDKDEEKIKETIESTKDKLKDIKKTGMDFINKLKK